MRDILNSYSASALKKEISKYNKKVAIRGYSKMTKSELVNAMMKHQDTFIYLKKKEKAPKPAAKPAPPKKEESKPTLRPQKKPSEIKPDNITSLRDYKLFISRLGKLNNNIYNEDLKDTIERATDKLDSLDMPIKRDTIEEILNKNFNNLSLSKVRRLFLEERVKEDEKVKLRGIAKIASKSQWEKKSKIDRMLFKQQTITDPAPKSVLTSFLRKLKKENKKIPRPDGFHSGTPSQQKLIDEISFRWHRKADELGLNPAIYLQSEFPTKNQLVSVK